ncbi:retrovirus-related Pol polyprotein from transposon 297 [Trichonephila clavipes]|nr:retrovirus-related Pol polyprotein from transposon 297 [Trichonephila clavipes]
MASGHSLPQVNLSVQGGTQGGSHRGTQRHNNPEFRVGSNFRVILEQYFWGVENVTDFFRQHFDNNLTYYEIPTQLACAYLKGHLTGRALDWFDVLGYRVVEGKKATDYARLKQALTEQLPVVRNRPELETRFNASYQNHNQIPSDFVYELLKIHKQLKVGIVEEKLLYHVISRKIGGIPELTTDTLTIADRRGNATDLDVKVLVIIGGSIVDAKVVNLIIDSIIKAVDRVVRGTGLSGVRMVKTDSLVIPDDQIKQLPIVEKPVEIDLSNTKLGEGQKQKLQELFNSFKGLFSDQPGLTHVLYHEIDTGDQRPVVSRPYRYDRVKQGIIDYHIEKMLQEDSIEAYRFAIDYRKLNAITKYPRYPLPSIDDPITNIPHTAMMLTLDLKSGYFQLNPKDNEKTAFITRTFAFLHFPFGLSGAAPNFQKSIDIILKPVLGRFVSCYMDDVIITSPSFNEHIDHLNQIFTMLRDAGLTLNKDKCHFARDKLNYLGLIISKDGIKTEDNKVKAITEMKPPKNNKEVSKFLRMAGWYQKFIKNYADICEPLYRLKKKGAKFNWSTEAQDSFNKVKRALTEAPVLQLPNFQEQFNLFTDASRVGIGAVLNQNHRPIAFTSRTLNKAERNYTVTEREFLAVIWALNKFRTYFVVLPVKVITANAALTKLTNGKNLSSRMIRWVLKLSEFNIEWEHHPGAQNVVADVLSRNPVDNVEGSQISCVALRALVLNSREQLIQEQWEDPELGHIYRYLENPDDGSVHANVCEDLLGPYPASRPERYRFILVIADHFTKWSELIPLRKALAQAIANALFENYISRYEAPISLISGNGPQFISDIFEHLSHRMDIKHIKTVMYRPQANLTERVNRALVLMIACFVEENHNNWDRFLLFRATHSS